MCALSIGPETDDDSGDSAVEEESTSPTASEVLGDLSDYPPSPVSDPDLYPLSNKSPSPEAQSPTPASSFITAAKHFSTSDLQASWDRDMARRKRRHSEQARVPNKRLRGGRRGCGGRKT